MHFIVFTLQFVLILATFSHTSKPQSTAETYKHYIRRKCEGLFVSKCFREIAIAAFQHVTHPRSHTRVISPPQSCGDCIFSALSPCQNCLCCSVFHFISIFRCGPSVLLHFLLFQSLFKMKNSHLLFSFLLRLSARKHQSGVTLASVLLACFHLLPFEIILL